MELPPVHNIRKQPPLPEWTDNFLRSCLKQIDGFTGSDKNASNPGEPNLSGLDSSGCSPV